MSNTHVDAVRGELEKLGLQLHVNDLQHLERGEETVGRIVHRDSSSDTRVWLPRAGEALDAIGRRSEAPVLVVGDFIRERTAEHLRAAGVWFADVAGNTYISFEGVHIDVRGRPRRVAARTVPIDRPVRSTNLFSTKRAQVMFALFTWPEVARAPMRQIAEVAGVSVGQVQQTLVLLEERGDMHGREFTDAPRLFEMWVAAYASGLAHTLRIKQFHGDVGELRTGESTVYLSGAAALPEFMSAEELVMYIPQPDSALYAKNRWRVDRAPNIFVRRKFWTAPDELLRESEAAVRLAPSTLVYADLRASDDGRQNEAAQWLKDRDDRLRAL